MEAAITTPHVQISQLDALWTLFQSQSQPVRKAFTERLLEQLSLSKKRTNIKTPEKDTIKQLDEQLFGCISLPEDFDYEAEILQVLNSKYQL